MLLACGLAKAHQPTIDIRKPYTEIGPPDAYSGRTYDEAYITRFVLENGLPCNPTTAFLTPALRNRNATLTPDTNLVGRPPAIYEATLQLLTDVYTNAISAEDLLAETIRWLLLVKAEKDQRMTSLLAGLRTIAGAVPLSSEATVTLNEQHLQCKGASRLPVLVVAAAYQAAEHRSGERVLPLVSHNAADRQTGALGDLEITLLGDNQIVTAYEMKAKRVSRDDIDIAVGRIAAQSIQNYIFITTDVIDPAVREYASGLYETLGGVEIALLDCVSFLRHFLHLFHRLRSAYLEAYQQLVLQQPDSAVGSPLKEAWLALRQAAEAGSVPTDEEQTPQ